MRWENGSELDQNLASVFGISVEPEDSTSVPGAPVTLRIKKWPAPAYSPYTKEQVLAATLRCLVNSANGTPEQPLDVRVIAEGVDDQPLEKKYSGPYVTRPGALGEAISPTVIPDTTSEWDARGIEWVVFPQVTRKPVVPSQPPSMIALRADGDGDAGWFLLPVWGNGENEDAPLALNASSAPLLYSAAYRSRAGPEANSFVSEASDGRFEVSGDSVTFSAVQVPADTLAATILALVIAAQPTEVLPLRVSLHLDPQSVLRYSAFRSAAGWRETNRNPDQIVLECEFVWDAAARQLAKGSVPLVALDEEQRLRFIVPVKARAEPQEAPESQTRPSPAINHRDSSVPEKRADSLLDLYNKPGPFSLWKMESTRPPAE